MEQKSNKNKNRTLIEQKEMEKIIDKIFSMEDFDIKNAEKFEKDFEYISENHFNFGKRMMLSIPGSYSGVDSGLPWFSYWVLNILEICSMNKYELSHTLKLKFVNYLKELQHPEGGFSGYSGGLAHLISNYAAVMAIMSLGIKEGYEIIDREKMRSYLKRMKPTGLKGYKFDKQGHFLIKAEGDEGCSQFNTNWPGAFQVHENGESDLRSVYCALTVAYILNLLDGELLEGVVENIKLSQTFEGGLGPEPFCEAHGGYSFCGIATLVLLNKLEEIDVSRFLQWLVNKQMTVEGGFQGRTNKLVDSCYSFWQGSVFNLLLMSDEKKYSYDSELLYNQLALQAYILFCCQNPSGGLFDKPGKPADLFHTNYATVGLALSQKCLLKDEYGEFKVTLTNGETMDFKEINPIFCVASDKVEMAKNYFWTLDK